MKKIINSLILSCLFLANAFSQSYRTAGGFLYRHYGVKSYNAHPKNFSIIQNDRDIMYFGNAYGVLEFDGNSWKLISLPNGNSALSLRKDKARKIYVGAYNEFGHLGFDSIGRTNYTTLVSSEVLGGVVDIHHFQNVLTLQTFSGLYFQKNNSTHKFNSPDSDIQFSKVLDTSLYVHEPVGGLQTYSNGAFQKVPFGNFFKNRVVRDIIKLEENKLLILEQNGIVVLSESKVVALNESTNKVVGNFQLRKIIRLNNGNFIITTGDSGFFILNSSGGVINHVNHENGFTCNVINDVFVDRRGGVWFALDNGITYMELNSPLSYFGSVDGIQGLGYAAALYDNKLYLGTSEGLYYCDWNKDGEYKKFRSVNGVKGQIYSLDVIDNTLLCSQVEHLYQIKNGTAIEIPSEYDGDGNWKIAALVNHPGYALKGTYLGFQLYKKEKDRWKFVNKLTGFEESARVFVQEANGDIWVCHGNKGMYKVQLSNDLSKVVSSVNYNDKNHLAPDFFNYVSYINNQLVFSADDGAYRIDGKGNFVKLEALESWIGKGRYLNRMVQNSDGSIWVFSGNEVLFYNAALAKDFQLRQNSFLRKITGDFIGGYELVIPLSSDRVIIGAQEGFILFNWKDKSILNVPYKTEIRSVKASMKNDSLLFAGEYIGRSASVMSLPYAVNSLRISFSAYWFENSDAVRYQYSLAKGDDSTIHWSAWSFNSQVDFSNLREGNYLFRVRAMNNYGDVSQAGVYAFTIHSPWFRSWWAYAFYLFLLSIAIIVSSQFLKKQFVKIKERVNAVKKRELLIQEHIQSKEKLISENELIAQKNEKLEADMVAKNNELASLATLLAQKTELLNHLREKLEGLNSEMSEDRAAYKEVIKTIDQDWDFDANWAQFQKHFDEIHSGFLHRLREKYPKLNPSWLLLCAYIKMNKSNKEIATLLNISVAGVEKRKYRLREKLTIENDHKLSDFLLRF